MRRLEAHGLLAALPAARSAWLHRVVADISADALWLGGSLGRGAGDEWSDVDLIVVGGEPLLHGALLTLAVPHNGPAAGRYVGAMYPLGELLLWVDWYQWPADLPIPRDTRLLLGQGHPSPYPLFDILDRHGRGRRATPGDPSTFTLAMLFLTAKFIARGNTPVATRMGAMLGVDPHSFLLDGLRDLLARTTAPTALRERIGRVLDVTVAISTTA